jgi:hypothetical protein
MDRSITTPTSTTHYLSLSVRWLIVVSVPLLLGLLAWGAMEVIKNYLSGKGNPNIWVTGFVLVVLGAVIVALVASLLQALRGRVTLTDDALIVRGALTTRVISTTQLLGFRRRDGQLALFTKQRRWPVLLTYFTKREIIEEWLLRHAPYLDALELAAEAQAIQKDQVLGISSAQKERTLGQLRRLVSGINVFGYAAAALGVVNTWFIGNPTIERVAVAVLVLVPVFLSFLALRHRGLVRFNYNEGSTHAKVFFSMTVCGAALALMSLADTATLLGGRFFEWFALVTFVNGVLWLFAEWSHVRREHVGQPLLFAVTVVGYFILQALWAGGAVYQTNKHLDESSVAWHTTTVLQKKMARGELTPYRVEVAPWAPEIPSPQKLVVSGKQYQRFEVGMRVDVGVRRGWLDIPWVAEIRPALN